MRALLVVFAALVLAAPAQAQAAPDPTTLSVTGRATVQVTPDLATVGVEVRRAGLTGEAARSSVDRRTNQILSGLARLGITRTEVQTSGITLQEQRLKPRRKGGRARVRFVALNDLTVRTKRLAALSGLFGVVTRAGATDVSGPDFSVEDRTPGRATATTAAVADARRRAEAAAAALGLRVTGVRSVVLDPESRSDGVAVEPTSATGSPSGSEKTPPTPVRPGTEDVDATVSVVFLLAP
jgi:uncharacterized protein